MRQAFEAATKAIETVKKTVQEKWESFKNKFEGTKSEMASEVMKAESPEDLIAAGKKLQEQGEALKMEKESVDQEKIQEGEMESAQNEMMGDMQVEGGVMNKEFDANKAAEKAEAERLAAEQAAAEQAEAERVAAEEQAAHEEYVRTTEAANEARLAEIRATLNGEGAEPAKVRENEEPAMVENAESAAEKTQEKEPIDVIELNNKIVNERNPDKKAEMLANLSGEQIDAVAELALNNQKSNGFDGIYQTLSNFKFKKEIMESPSVKEALKDVLSNGRTHIYNMERVLSVLPESSNEILNDPAVRKGLIESSASAMRNAQDKSDKESFMNTMDRLKLSSSEIHDIAELIKQDVDAVNSLVAHFGHSAVYPDYNK